MELQSTPRPARFRRKIVSVVTVVPNSPTHRRYTIECELECGHSRCILRVNRNGTTTAEQCAELIGLELQCAKCFVTDRLRKKTGDRRGRRSATIGRASGSNVAATPRG
jgi:hypothetical protein